MHRAGLQRGVGSRNAAFSGRLGGPAVAAHECGLHTPFRAHSGRTLFNGPHRRRDTGTDQNETPGQGDENDHHTQAHLDHDRRGARRDRLGAHDDRASAEGWPRRAAPDYAYARSERRDWDRGRHATAAPLCSPPPPDNTGKYIALGVGALMLGIIASEAGRR